MHPHWLCSTPMRVDSLPLKSSVSCRLLKPVIFKCKANASVNVNFQHCFPSSAVMFIISALSGHIFYKFDTWVVRNGVRLSGRWCSRPQVILQKVLYMHLTKQHQLFQQQKKKKAKKKMSSWLLCLLRKRKKINCRSIKCARGEGNVRDEWYHLWFRLIVLYLKVSGCWKLLFLCACKCNFPFLFKTEHGVIEY